MLLFFTSSVRMDQIRTLLYPIKNRWRSNHSLKELISSIGTPFYALSQFRSFIRRKTVDSRNRAYNKGNAIKLNCNRFCGLILFFSVNRYIVPKDNTKKVSWKPLIAQETCRLYAVFCANCYIIAFIFLCRLKHAHSHLSSKFISVTSSCL